MKEEATELEYLKYFYQNAGFGPVHEYVVGNINRRFEEDRDKLVPKSYRKDE